MMNDDLRYKVNREEVLHRCEAYMLFYVRIQPRQRPPTVPKARVIPPSSRKRQTPPAASDTPSCSPDAALDTMPVLKRFKSAQPQQQYPQPQQAQRAQQAQQSGLKQHAAALLGGLGLASGSTPSGSGLAQPSVQPPLPSSSASKGSYGSELVQNHSNGLVQNYGNGLVQSHGNGLVHNHDNGLVQSHGNGLMHNHGGGLVQNLGNRLVHSHESPDAIPAGLSGKALSCVMCTCGVFDCIPSSVCPATAVLTHVQAKSCNLWATASASERVLTS